MRGWTTRWTALVAAVAAAGLAAMGTMSQAAPGDGPVLFAGGVAVVEAEDHDAKVARSSHDWTAITGPAGLVGTAIQATPDTGARITASIPTTSPEVGYRVLFPAAGTYQLWVRASAISNGNTLHAGRDGQVTSKNVSWSPGSWSWKKLALAIPSAGQHTVQLWMREDGLRLDRLLLAQSSAFTPSGSGPAVTPRQSTGPDTTAPTLAARQPAPGATDVAIGADVVATFSEAMNPATLTASTFTLAPTAGGPAVGATIAASAGSTTFTLDPASSLAFATSYTATVTTGAADAAGNPIAAQQTWSFMTAAAPDTTAPALTGRQPAPGATAVAAAADVVATFSEAMNPATLTASTFTLAPTAGGPAVGATIAASAGSTTFTLDPASSLAFATSYTATVTTGAADAAGNPIAAQQTWSFTTAPAPEPGAGAVTFVAGLAAVEAEDADARTPRSGHAWSDVTGPAGLVGAAVAATPDSGAGAAEPIASTSPELGFRVRFPSAGTYYLWLRANPLDTAGNSAYVGLDGAVAPSYLSSNAYGAWGWMGGRFSGGRATLAVPSAGEHLVNVWMREDGFRLDRLVLAVDAAFTPSGAGPAATPREGGPATPAFGKVTLPGTAGPSYTTLVVGPDGKLYAGSLDGTIRRFPILADGTVGAAETITSLRDANGGARNLLGLAFDPAATAGNLVLWASHGYPGFDSVPDWTGKVTRLSGSALGTVQDVVTGLPRSVRDHAGNGIAFGPDGALYLSQGGTTEMGAAAPDWENRPERLLGAAILRIDTSAIAAPPLDVRTEEGGSYDPFAAGAPVTIHASGFRNSYDLAWHSSGRLYVTGNGGSAGGVTPGTPSPLPASCARRIDDGTAGDYAGPSVPALTGVAAQDDHLFRVVPGGYYGHPNPARCEWVMNGGNPTAGADPAQVAEYPVGTQPDRNWRGIAHDFGLHVSANGIVEYRGDAFGGALQGALIVTRYGLGDDLVVLEPGPSGDIAATRTGLPGMTGFGSPVDLVENRATGDLYVAEYGARRITLLRPGG